MKKYWEKTDLLKNMMQDKQNIKSNLKISLQI